MPRPALTSSTDYTPADPNAKLSMADLFAPAPKPKTELERYRLLSPSAAIRVSPLCLGAMSLGDQWTPFMGGALNFEESCKFLDTFYEAGGNFIDTANNYQNEQSEMIIGEWMEKRGIRDEIVLATKYTTFCLDRKEGKFQGIGANFVGNHKKSLRLSVEDSLKKLRTSYIDLLYVHWWDYSTSIPELMQSLNDLVKSGKVLYLGISDTPAWVVSQANEYARHHGLAQFAVYQGLWNLGVRDLERDVIPMARANGMSIAPWGALGQGKFKSPEELKNKDKWRAGAPPTEQDIKISEALSEVAKELAADVKPASIAMAWVRQTVTNCFPIIGGTNPEHLKANIEALKITLTDKQMEKLNDAYKFDYGFPYNRFGRDPHYLPEGKPDNGLLTTAAHLKYTQLP
ncbi:aryl-alcohol dehydrogenase [Cryptococcus neoformans Bt1]|nr:aryl-alcohol dehydrogenase [Cryptococcus neoformans var. grubii Bt1]